MPPVAPDPAGTAGQTDASGAEIRLDRGRTRSRGSQGRGWRSMHTPDAHARHALEHLERLAAGVTAVARPEQIFLGHEDGELFWELIGMRIEGHPSLIFGAVAFRRQDLPGTSFGREPLASYLEGPSPTGRDRALPGTMPVLLPRDQEGMPSFLKGLRFGREVSPVLIETSRIRVAFDLRLASPATLPTLQRQAGPLRQHVFRTDQGHVLTGLSHGLGGAPHLKGSFVTIKRVRQITPRGKLVLPNLVMHRSCLTLAADVDSRDRDMAAARWVPFSAASASSRHLLLD